MISMKIARVFLAQLMSMCQSDVNYMLCTCVNITATTNYMLCTCVNITATTNYMLCTCVNITATTNYSAFYYTIKKYVKVLNFLNYLTIISVTV
jgi:hypothetical protein